MAGGAHQIGPFQMAWSSHVSCIPHLHLSAVTTAGTAVEKGSYTYASYHRRAPLQLAGGAGLCPLGGLPITGRRRRFGDAGSPRCW